MKQTLLVANLMVAAAILATAQKTPESMLGAALHQEEVQGELKGAIAAYQKVVATPGVSRKTAAEALVHMGQCYEKLGDAESRKAYERVVREFADQKEAVAVARARLGGAERADRPGGIALRKVWAAGGDDLYAVSPDGRRLTHVDGSSPSTDDWGRLLLHDVAAGTDRELTTRMEGWVHGAAISRDGTQVAYGLMRRKDNGWELRIASLQGNGVPPARRLSEGGAVSIVPLDWSPDGKWIAVRVRREDRTAQIGLVAVKDGSLRVLKSVDWRGPTKISFSPDGQDLAFDLPVSESSDQRDVFVLAADGSRETPAVVHPSNDVVVGWSPDGKHLLFASDRSGSMSLWALGFANRKPQGSPELVKPDIGNAWSMGVTSAGALYLAAYGGGSDIEVASIDLDTGKQIAPLVRPIQSFVGSNAEPSWSRDGKYLAYVSGRGFGDFVIAIRSVDAGEVQELQLRPKLRWMAGLSWAPDGHSFAVFGTELKGRDGVFRIDAHTGQVSPIAFPIPPTERLSYEGFFWSPDSKRIYYHSQNGTIHERDLASGNEREVIRGNLGPISLSPDGRWIATTKREPSTQSQAVVLVPVAGGEPRELLRVTEPQWINNTSMPWTPDGRAVLVRKMLVAGGKSSELWIVPIAGVPARKLDFDANRVKTYAHGKIRLHPDGRQLAYVSGESGGEVWVLENFLSTLDPKK